MLETIPDVLGPGVQPDLEWRGPNGERHEGAAALVVSNNPYRLGHRIGDPSRPRLDNGVLGVAVLDEAGARQWCTPSFEVDAHAAVPAGVDGERAVLTPPLHFRIRPAALRCRIARHHPGASPSAFEPARVRVGIRALVGIAAGHDPAPVPRARRDEKRRSLGHAV
ncbi:MAG: hypothetical protein ACYC8T_18500 [Myxococcaceae bacterium]